MQFLISDVSDVSDVGEVINEPDIMPDVVNDTKEYDDDCFRVEYYFCPPLDAIWKIEVIVNICTDPPEISKQRRV